MAGKKTKTKETVIQDFQNDLDSFLVKTTGTKIEKLSERDSVPYWLPTNCHSLNWIISNDFFKGMPGTKAIMISGKSGKGKSLLGDVILGENIKVNDGYSYKLDIEDAGTHEFTAKIVGSAEIAAKIRIISAKTLSDKTKMKDKVITIEKLTQILTNIINYQSSLPEDQRKPVVVLIDSVTQLTSEKEIDRVYAQKDAKDMTAAVKMRELFRSVTQSQKDANLTIIGLAQLTANIGVMFGPKDTENAKGTGFGYASSLTLQMTSDKELVKSVKGGAEIPVGIKMRMKTTKNRIEFKGRDAWLYFYFQTGIDQYGGLLELLAQYGVFKASAKASVIGEYAPSNTFKWVDNSNQEEYTFKIGNFSKFMRELDEEKRNYLLKKWNEEINQIYKDLTSDRDETELLEDDGPEDEEMLEQQMEEEDEG